MSDIQPLLTVAAILIIVCIVIGEGLKRLFDASLERLIAQRDYDLALALLDKRSARMLFPTFKQYYLRFSIYEAAGRERLARKMLDHLLAMSSSGKRRRALALVAFSFYVDKGDEKGARTMLDEIQRDGDPAARADCRETFRIVFEGAHDSIERMEAVVDRVDDQARCKLYYLLERQYRNSGDRVAAKRYRNLLEELKQRGAARP